MKRRTAVTSILLVVLGLAVQPAQAQDMGPSCYGNTQNLPNNRPTLCLRAHQMDFLDEEYNQWRVLLEKDGDAFKNDFLWYLVDESGKQLSDTAGVYIHSGKKGENFALGTFLVKPGTRVRAVVNSPAGGQEPGNFYYTGTLPL